MRTLNNRKGQFVIETVLMMVITVGFFIWGMGQLKESKFLSKLISGPWEKVAGMIESGNWETRAVAQTKHPNTIDRGQSLDPGD